MSTATRTPSDTPGGTRVALQDMPNDYVLAEPASSGVAMVWLTVSRDDEPRSTFLEPADAEAIGMALIAAAARARQNAAGETPGYCRHGRFIGGVGVDHICGDCEDGI